MTAADTTPDEPTGHDDDGQLGDWLKSLGLPPRTVGQIHVHAAAAHAGTLDQLLAMMRDDPEQYEQLLDGMVEHVEADGAEGDDDSDDDEPAEDDDSDSETDDEPETDDDE